MWTRQYTAGRWVYPSLDAEMRSVGLDEVETYILYQHNNISQYIVTRAILGLYLSSKQLPGARVTRRWRDQSRINYGKEDGRAVERTGEADSEGKMEDNMYMESAERQGAAE